MGLFDFILGKRAAKVSKETKRKSEKFIIENPDHPVSNILLRSIAKNEPFGRVRVNTLVKKQVARKLQPFVR